MFDGVSSNFKTMGASIITYTFGNSECRPASSNTAGGSLDMESPILTLLNLSSGVQCSDNCLTLKDPLTGS